VKDKQDDEKLINAVKDARKISDVADKISSAVNEKRTIAEEVVAIVAATVQADDELKEAESMFNLVELDAKQADKNVKDATAALKIANDEADLDKENRKAAVKDAEEKLREAVTVKNEAEAKKLVAQKALDDATATLKALNGPAG